MAPSTATKPKRKRQRKRKEVESSSSSSSSSSESDDEETTIQPITLPQASTSTSSSSEASSSSEDESSEDERSKRRGRIPNLNKSNNLNGNTTTSTTNTTTTSTSTARRPYPSRSPSPQIFNPANLPLGQNPFPLLRTLDSGLILNGLVVGDKEFRKGESEGENVGGDEVDEDKIKEDELKENQFGEWWRARLVSEFETDLGGLAVEPGLTPSRLTLLLDSLTALSTLHTTSSSLVKKSNSIWIHDPSVAVDPLNELELGEGDGDDWGKRIVGGLADVEVGEEGVRIDLRKENNEITSGTTEKMEID